MEYIIEPERKTPVRSSYDVVVCGGGIAGISAALAAARHKAKVLLLEREFLLGGLATLGLVTYYLPLCDGCGRQVSFGIAEELLRLSVKHGYEEEGCEEWFGDSSVEERIRHRYRVQYSPYVFAIEAEKLLLDSGVDILYGSVVCAAARNGSRIDHVVIEAKSERYAVHAGAVIDCTGDADVCALAGEETACCGEGNFLASWYYHSENGKNALKMLGYAEVPDAEKTPKQLEEEKTARRFYGFSSEKLSEIGFISHASTLRDYLKGGEVSQTHALSAVSAIPQVRMTRRLAGAYTQDDTEMHMEFADSVGMFGDWRKPGPVYELPYHTLVGNTVANLITAGRCISVTDAMWDITRVIPVCAVSGQAAGAAAAMHSDVRDIDVSALKEELKKAGVVLHEKDL